MQRRIERGDVARHHDGVPGFWPDGAGAARSGVRSSLRASRHGRRPRGDLGLHGFALLPAGCDGAVVRELDGRALSTCCSARRRFRAHGPRAGGARRALAGDARSVLGARLRLGAVGAISDRQGLAIRRVPGHAHRGGARRRRASHTSPFHRAADRGCEAGSRPSGRGHGLLDRVQHLGRLESLPGHHRAETQSVRNDREPRAPVVPRFRGSARERASGAARDCSPARGGAALSPYGVGVREWLLQQVRLGRMGELRPAFLSLGRTLGLRGGSREPARAAFRSGHTRRLRLRRVRGTRRILDVGDARCHRPLRRTRRPRRAVCRKLHVANTSRAERQGTGLLQVPRPCRGSLVRIRRSVAHHGLLGSERDRPFRSANLRSQRDEWALCRLGSLRTARGVRGFPVYRPEHWAFAETGLCYGDLLGAEGHAFGYEVDGLDYVVRGGLPEPRARRAVHPPACRFLRSASPL